MPMYVFRCSRDCGHEVEEIRKFSEFNDPPPVSAEACAKGADLGDGTREAHDLQFAPSAWSAINWRGEHSNDGIGGWERQSDGQAMVRRIKGREHTKYGEGA